MFFLSIQLLLIKHAASIFHGRLLIKFVYPTELKSVRTSNLYIVQKALKWANRPCIRLLKSGSQSTQKLQSHCSITLICSRFIVFLNLFGVVFILPISLSRLINKSRNIINVRNNSPTKSHLNDSSSFSLTSIISALRQDVILVSTKLAQRYK